MARIRSIKPEFWDSPSTAKAGPWARLAFIAMWNWADDFGRGTANLKELEGFIFPFDETFTDMHGNTVNFRSVVAEVAEHFGVVFYEADGRPYYAIPSWEKHQRNERRAKGSKYPAPPADAALASPFTPIAEMHGISASPGRKSSEAPNISDTGTGEQGNRGTGEQTSSSPIADAIREDVEALCEHLASRIEGNGSKKPTVGKLWRDQARLLLDLDKRTPEEAHRLIDWCQDDAFWMANIQSMAKFRQKFDQLRLQSQRAAGAATPEQKSAAAKAWGPQPTPPAYLFDRGDEDAS